MISKVFKLSLVKGGRAPMRAHRFDACFDCFARVEDQRGLQMSSGEVLMFPLGFRMALQPGWEALVRPRSGFAQKGLQVSLGTVDAGYRGEVGVVLYNLTGGLVRIKDGDRICQIAVRPIQQVDFVVVPAEDLPESCDERGDSGWGSTGC